MSNPSLREYLERRRSERPIWKIPEGYIRVSAAVDRVGRAKFGQAWEQVVDRRQHYRKALHDGLIASLDTNDPERVAATKRHEEAAGPWEESKPRYVAAIVQVRELLSEANLTAFEFAQDELPRPVEARFWKTAEADKVFEIGLRREGGIDLSTFGRAPLKEHLVIVSADQVEKLLENAIKGERSTGSEEQEAPSAEAEEPRSKRGRRPKYKWEDFSAQVVLIADYDGLPESQAELEKKMLQWCQNNWGCQPGASTVRERLRPLYQRLLQKDYISEP